MGAALAAPRLALAAADREAAAGRTGSDAAALIALAFVAGHVREIVIAGWLTASASVRAGLNALAVALSHALATDLLVLVVGAALLFLTAGRARSAGRDFDLACVAFVPYLTVKVATSLVAELAGLAPGPAASAVVSAVAFGWAAAVLYLGWKQARSRLAAELSA